MRKPKVQTIEFRYQSNLRGFVISTDDFLHIVTEDDCLTVVDNRSGREFVAVLSEAGAGTTSETFSYAGKSPQFGEAFLRAINMITAEGPDLEKAVKKSAWSRALSFPLETDR